MINDLRALHAQAVPELFPLMASLHPELQLRTPTGSASNALRAGAGVGLLLQAAHALRALLQRQGGRRRVWKHTATTACSPAAVNTATSWSGRPPRVSQLPVVLALADVMDSYRNFFRAQFNPIHHSRAKTIKVMGQLGKLGDKILKYRVHVAPRGDAQHDAVQRQTPSKTFGCQPGPTGNRIPRPRNV